MGLFFPYRLPFRLLDVFDNYFPSCYWSLILTILIGFNVHSEPIAVIVNKSNPAVGLTETELARIYRGSKVYWKDGSKIIVINRPIDSDIRWRFYNRALHTSPSTKFYHNPTPIPFKPTVVVSDLSTKRFVAYIPSAIGYIFARNIDNSVKVVRILEGLEIKD